MRNVTVERDTTIQAITAAEGIASGAPLNISMMKWNQRGLNAQVGIYNILINLRITPLNPRDPEFSPSPSYFLLGAVNESEILRR